MPVTVNELDIHVDLLSREVGPVSEPDELGRRIEEIEARLSLLESVIMVDEENLVIEADRITIKARAELELSAAAAEIVISDSIELSSGNSEIEVGGGNISFSSVFMDFEAQTCSFTGTIDATMVMTTTLDADISIGAASLRGSGGAPIL